MCGIFGVSESKNLEFVRKFKNYHHHRGPDAWGHYVDSELTLLHNRLAILDIEQGVQPMKFKNFIIVFNGEIFNSPKLRKELEINGYTFTTKNSDTEVLLKLYDLKKEKMLDVINGMFSFVIYDLDKRILFGAVDQFSIKPLYYSKKNLFYFSSEIKAILNIEEISKEISKQNLNYYFSLQYSPYEHTMYKDIKKLKGNQYFIYDLNEKKLEIFDYIRKKKNYFFSNYEEVIDKGKEILHTSVENWMLSDVNISCSLSGGLDSSLIASIFAQKSKNKINTISIGFGGIDLEHDESDYAEKVSKFIGSNHTNITVNSDELLDDLDVIFQNLCEPYAGSLASWFVYKNISTDKVIFTGTGADELFGNYGKWKNYQVSEIFTKNLLSAFLNQKSYNFKYYYGFLYKKIFYEKNIHSLLANDFHIENNLQLTKLIDENLIHRNIDSKKIIQEIDLKLQLPGEFLYITDRLSMMNSVEARTPFLDNELIDFISSVDAKFYGGLLNSKKLLKDIAKDMIPEDIISRRKKGFVLPKNNWLKGNYKKLLKKYTEKKYIEKQGIFNFAYIENLQNNFYKLNETNLTERMWTYFIFQFWYEKNYNSFKF